MLRKAIAIALFNILMLTSHKPTIKAPASRYPAAALDPLAIKRAKYFTVAISQEGFGSVSRGTGILIDETHVLTCLHVAQLENEELWVYFYPGYLTARGKLVYSSIWRDLAILEIDVPVHGAPVPVFQANAYDGEPITIIGNAVGAMKWFVTYGIISGGDARDWYTDGLVLHGDSGGPWINGKGEVVAVTDYLLESDGVNTGIGGGVSGKTISKFLEEWRQPKMDFEIIISTHVAPKGKP